MEQLSQLNFLLASLSEPPPAKGRTPGEIGEELFRDLLKKSSEPLKEEEWGFSMYERRAQGMSAARELSDDSERSLGSLDRALRRLGRSFGQAKLPDSAVPQLIAYLQGMGIQREKTEQLVASARDRDGSVDLTRLMARLQGGMRSDLLSKGGVVVEARHVPQVGEILFQMGLGVGEVKEVTERALGQKGELALDSLIEGLRKFIPDPQMESRIVSLLKEKGITAKPQVILNGGMDPDLKRQIETLSHNPTQDNLKKVKENIASLLTQKGIPPQEVKTFLETLSVGHARSLLGQTEGASAGQTKGQQDKDGAALMERVVIRSRPEWNKGGYQDKILEILQNERLLVADGKANAWHQEDAPFRLTAAEPPRQGEQKVKILTTQTVSLPETRPSQGAEGSQQTKTEQRAVSSKDMKDQFAGAETPKFEAGLARIEKDLQAANAAVSKDQIALPQPLPKVMDRIMWMIQSGEQKGRLSLSPPELGRLDLDLVIKQGHLQASVSTETLPVKEIIEANLNQLKQQLTDLGFVVDKFDVMVGLNDRPSFQDLMWRDRGGREPQSRDSHGRAAGMKVESEPERPSRSSLYQIDLLV